MWRGPEDRGANLVIAREYISHGIRERAMRLATLDLGPRTDLEIEARLREDSGAERLTTLDRRLVRDMDENRIVGASDSDPFQQSLHPARLQKLAQLRRADQLGNGTRRIAGGIEDTLLRLGERRDPPRTKQPHMTSPR